MHEVKAYLRTILGVSEAIAWAEKVIAWVERVWELLRRGGEQDS